MALFFGNVNLVPRSIFILIPILNYTFIPIALTASWNDPTGAIVLTHIFACYFTVYQAFDINLVLSTAIGDTANH